MKAIRSVSGNWLWLPALVLLGTTLAYGAAPGDAPDALLADLKSDNGATRRAAWERAAPLGAPAVAPLIALLDHENKDVGRAAFNALSRIAHHSARPGAANERRAVTGELLKALEDDAIATKSWNPLLDLLAATAGDDGVATIAKLLDDENPRRREMARWALVRIPTPAATRALIDALEKAKPEFRIHLVIALGQKRAIDAVEPLLRLAERGDEDTRIEVLDALGRIGDPRAVEPIEHALASASDREAARLRKSYLRLADSMAQKGGAKRALGMYRTMLTGTSDVPSRCAALVGLGRVGSVETVDVVLPALTDDSQAVRAAATQCLTGLPGEAATRAIVEQYGKARGGIRASLIRVLVERKPKGLDEILKQAAKDKNAEVRVTALQLLGGLDDPSLEPVLIEAATEGSPAIRPVALRSYVKIADGRLARGEKENALVMYHGVLDLDPPEDVLRSALNGLRSIRSIDSLPKVEGLFRHSSAGDDARRAYVAIVGELGKTESEKERAIKMLTDLVQTTRQPDVVRAAIVELRALGADTTGFAAKAGFITRWNVCGSFPVNGDNPWGKAWFPEKEVTLAQKETVDGRTVGWKEHRTDDPQGRIDFLPLFKPNNNSAAYAYAELSAPREREVHVRIGTDDGVIFWINGERVHANNAARSWSPDQDTVKVKLREGVNQLLFKVINGGGDWALSARVANLQNRPLDMTRFGE